MLFVCVLLASCQGLKIKREVLDVSITLGWQEDDVQRFMHI